MHISQPQKIFVGISGGVDSSVAAYLLKKEGHDVHGVYVKPWSPEWLPCTWVAEKRDAMRVCAKIDIPFHFLDGSEIYERGVAEYMINEYRQGRTPNPDVLCNRVIKFGLLWEYARSRGAQAVATGHYARTDSNKLYQGFDSAKDQSYFLWMLKASELEHVRFPIGELAKSEVREIASTAGLFTSDKKDSQGICFLGDVDMKDFLAHYIRQEPGEVVDEKGNVIGSHDGVWFYTIGERHGFIVTATTADQKPYYVIGKDTNRNRLIVSQAPSLSREGSKTTLILREVNWLVPVQSGYECQAQFRYHGPLVKANIVDERTVTLSHDGVLAAGQSLVLYQGNLLIGGGIIDTIK